jgi:hypothetical protein
MVAGNVSSYGSNNGGGNSQQNWPLGHQLPNNNLPPNNNNQPQVPPVMIGVGPGYNQMPTAGHHQMPVAGYNQMPTVGHHQMPVAAYNQMPMVGHRQMPVTGYHQMPVAGYHQMPVAGYHQMPVAGYHQIPVTGRHQMQVVAYNQMPVAGYHQMPVAGYHQMPIAYNYPPASNFHYAGQPNNYQVQHYGMGNYNTNTGAPSVVNPSVTVTPIPGGTRTEYSYTDKIPGGSGQHVGVEEVSKKEDGGITEKKYVLEESSVYTNYASAPSDYDSDYYAPLGNPMNVARIGFKIEDDVAYLLDIDIMKKDETPIVRDYVAIDRQNREINIDAENFTEEQLNYIVPMIERARNVYELRDVLGLSLDTINQYIKPDNRD